jgi:hypothetical protein
MVQSGPSRSGAVKERGVVMRAVGLTRGVVGAVLVIACASSGASSLHDAKAPTQTVALIFPRGSGQPDYAASAAA